MRVRLLMRGACACFLLLSFVCVAQRLMRFRMAQEAKSREDTIFGGFRGRYGRQNIDDISYTVCTFAERRNE